MKHLELFENHNNERREFWKLTLADPHYGVRLVKMGVPEDDMDVFLGDQEEMKEFKMYIYIGYNQSQGWSWSDKFHDYNSDHFYRGTPKITEEDIKNWEIKQTSGKYNL